MCRYKDKSEKNLNDSLVKVQEKLGKFKNVNKKAMDQFNQFTDQVFYHLSGLLTCANPSSLNDGFVANPGRSTLF